MSVDYQDITYRVEDPVAVITMNRPDALNAFTNRMLAEIRHALAAAEEDEAVVGIILTGAGRGFCAGLDLQDASAGAGIGGSGSGLPVNLDLRDAPPTVLHSLDTPTICALNGGAAGYGMDLALGCDIRIAGESAKLAAAFTRRGVLPESGGTWLLPRMIGWAKAAEIIFTGRTLSAEQCRELGLVSQVVPHEKLAEATRALADEVCASAPLAVRAAKRMMRAGQSEEFDNHVQHVFVQLLPLFRSKDFREGMMAFLEKREPNFEGQ